MRTTIVYIIGMIILLSLFSSTDIYGQRRGLRSKQMSTIDLVFGGDFGFRLIKSEDIDSDVLLENRKSSEDPKMNSRYGINYGHGLSETLSAKIGFRKAATGFNIPFVTEVAEPELINNSIKGSTITGSRKFHYIVNYHFFEVPLAIRQTMINSYCQPYFELGVSTFIYQKTKISEEHVLDNDPQYRKDYLVKEDVNKFNYLAYLSMGGNFKITKTIVGFSQIMARYQLNSLRNRWINEKYIGIGGEIGIRYYLETY